MHPKLKIVRAATVPSSLDVFCRGLLAELSAGGYEIVALSSPGPELEKLGKRESVRTVSVAMRREISPAADLVALVRLVRALRRERPHMVHSMTPKAGLLCMLAARIARVPVRVHTFTGLLFPTATGLRRRLLAACDRLICACATHVVPEGEGVRDDLQRARITRKPMRVLGHGNVRGVDPDHYSRSPELQARGAALRRTLGIPDGAPVFVFVGRLVTDKGIGELAEAFAMLDGNGAHLLLAGDEEPGRDPLPAAARALLDARPATVHRLGWQDDVRPALAAATALVLPSYREGFPNVVIEAGAMELPCVVTDINGSREIIADGRNGFIVPAHDAAALCRAMRRIADNPEAAAAMGAQARPMAVERFNQTYVRRCLKDFYAEILPHEHL